MNLVVLDGYLVSSKEKTQEIKYFVEVQDCYGHDRFVMGITALIHNLTARDMAMTVSVMAMKSADMPIKLNFSPISWQLEKDRKP